MKTARRPPERCAKFCCENPEVITVVSQHGRPDDGSDAAPFSNVELFAPLKPLDKWPKGHDKDKLTDQIQKEFDEQLPGVVFNFSQYIEDNIEEGISGVKGVNSVKIVGPNLKRSPTSPSRSVTKWPKFEE